MDPHRYTRWLTLPQAAASALPPTSPNPHALSRRQEGFPTQHTASAVNCGGFGAADSVDNYNNIENLMDDEVKPIAAKTCNRVGCFNTRYVLLLDDIRGSPTDLTSSLVACTSATTTTTISM